MSPPAPAAPPLRLREIFGIFLRAGLAFGGGLGILAVLEHELVERRRLISREEFLTHYGLGRIVPAGTMTALAVAFGSRLGGLPGTAVALTALVLPAFASTLALTIAYVHLRRGVLLDWMPYTLLPAALAFIAVAAARMAREVLRPAAAILALAALAGALLLRVNPALLLVLGGVAGAVLLRGEEAR
jgi:chromate transporter